MAKKREYLSKKLRFEVFKRDDFCCAYCGRTPGDGAKLQVDHVIPVAEGGGNEIENLRTSCRDCNIGKGKMMLSKKQTNRDLKKDTKKLQEQVEVLEEYYEFLKKKNELDRKRTSIELFEEISGEIPEDFRVPHIQKCIKKYGMDVAVSARKVFLGYENADVPYFFGIAKNLYLEKTHPDYKYKMNFYYKYIKPYDSKAGYNNKSYVFQYSKEQLEYYLNNYGTNFGEGDAERRINVGEDGYKEAAGLSDYGLGKVIVKDLKRLKEALSFTNIKL